MADPVLAVLSHWPQLAVGGLIATVVMTTVLEGAQLIGHSRLSLPFLFGTYATGDRYRAIVLGYVFYLIGGWIFAFLYGIAFEALNRSDWWFGLLLGFIHGMFLIAVFLPMLPYVHPRIASEFDGPDAQHRLEPPGAFGLHYGRMTPFWTVVAQSIFGVIVALAYPAVGN